MEESEHREWSDHEWQSSGALNNNLRGTEESLKSLHRTAVQHVGSYDILHMVTQPWKEKEPKLKRSLVTEI